MNLADSPNKVWHSAQCLCVHLKVVEVIEVLHCSVHVLQGEACRHSGLVYRCPHTQLGIQCIRSTSELCDKDMINA